MKQSIERVEMKRMSLLFIAAGALLGCDQLEVWNVERAVSEQLRDPDSAQFRSAHIVDGEVVCGEVNAKNAFGGYTGFQPYASVRGAGGGYTIYLEDGDDPGHVRMLCSGTASVGAAPGQNSAVQIAEAGEQAWNIQAASLSSEKEAADLVDKLIAAGAPAFTVNVEGMNRVFVGPYRERTDANEMREWLLGAFRLPGFVVRRERK